MSDTEAIAKRIVANAHRLEWAIQNREVTLADLVAVAHSNLSLNGRNAKITGEWLQQFCRVDGNGFSYKHVFFIQRSDGTWDCWIVGSCDFRIHLGNKWATRGDVYDLLNGMKIPLKGGL